MSKNQAKKITKTQKDEKIEITSAISASGNNTGSFVVTAKCGDDSVSVNINPLSVQFLAVQSRIVRLVSLADNPEEATRYAFEIIDKIESFFGSEKIEELSNFYTRHGKVFDFESLVEFISAPNRAGLEDAEILDAKKNNGSKE